LPAPLLSRRHGRPLGSRGLHRKGVCHALTVLRPNGAPEGLAELLAGILGAYLLEDVGGFTYARAFVGPVLADEHVDNIGFPLVVEYRLPAHAATELDALTIIRGDVRL